MGRGTLGSLVRIHRTRPPKKIKLKLSREKQKCLKWTVSTRESKKRPEALSQSAMSSLLPLERHEFQSHQRYCSRGLSGAAQAKCREVQPHTKLDASSPWTHDNEQKRHEKRTSKPRNILRVFCHTYGKRHVATKPAAREMYVQARGPHHGGAITPGSKGDGAIISRFLPKTSPPDCAAAAKRATTGNSTTPSKQAQRQPQPAASTTYAVDQPNTERHRRKKPQKYKRQQKGRKRNNIRGEVGRAETCQQSRKTFLRRLFLRARVIPGSPRQTPIGRCSRALFQGALALPVSPAVSEPSWKAAAAAAAAQPFRRSRHR